jgi:glutathione S-transferase
MSTASQKPIKIFGIPISVHTRKVIVAARLKSIPREVVPVVPVIPGNPPPNWLSISPTGLIPAIDDDGYVLADSTAIVSYFERKFPEPALLPADTRDYGRALFLDSWAGSALFRRVIHPLFHQQIVGPKIHETAGDATVIDTVLKQATPRAFTHLEALTPKAQLVADTLSIADLAVVSNLIMFHYLGHRIEAARFPKLAAYFRRQLDSPVMAETLQHERPFVENLGLDLAFLS